MPSPPESWPRSFDQYRRYLIAAGTQAYADLEACLPQVPDELTKVISLFESLGFEEQLPEVRLNPTAQELRASINEWLVDEGRTAEDVAVIYYTGHGATDADRHFLCTTDTVARQYAATALETDFLIRVLSNDTRVRRALIVLDTCDSGRGALDASETAGRMAVFRPQPQEDEGVWVLAASRPKEDAREAVFIDALSQAIRQLSTTTSHLQKYLSLETLVGVVNELLEQGGQMQRATYTPAGLARGLPPILQNPSYDPFAEPGRDLESAVASPLRPMDVDAHWDPRARGVEIRAQRGMYFSGRTAALRALAGWIGDPRTDTRPRVVTGAPGSGKSTVVARLVLVADREHQSVPLQGVDPETVPPAGSVHAAVLARAKTVDDLLEELNTTLGLRTENGRDLAAGLAGRHDPTVVAIDALDEARQPDQVVRRVIQPLAEAGVRLILAARRPLVQRLPFAVEVVDLDSDDYYSPKDLQKYVTAVLLAESDPTSPTPYRGEPEAAKEVAAVVADRAGHSFLVARIVARTLTRSRNRLAGLDLAQASRHWGSLAAAFEDDLARYGNDRDRVRDLLTALAWAEGDGLPWESIWAPLASALAGGLAYTDDDVRWLLDNAGAYVVEALDDDRGVFRLYHQEFANYLRRGWDPSEANATVTRSLLEQVPTDAAGRHNWFATHPYLRTYLAAHAARGGLIDSLLTDAGFLLAADPMHLSRNLFAAKAPEAQAAASVYLRYAGHVRDDSAVANPTSYLGLAARQSAQLALADATDRLAPGGGWRARWAHWRPTSPHLVLDRLEAPISALQLFARDKRSRLAATGLDGSVRIVDVETGDLVFAKKLPSPAWSVIVLEVDSLDLVVAGDYDGGVHVWSLPDGQMVARFQAHASKVRVLQGGILNERLVLVTAGRATAEKDPLDSTDGPGVFRVWDARTWSPLSPECRAFAASISTMHLIEVAGLVTLVCAGDAFGEDPAAASLVRGFDPLTGAQRFQLPTGPYGFASALPIRRADGNWRLLVRQSSSDSLSLWDLAEHRAVREASCKGTFAMAMADVVVAERHIVCVDRWDGLELRDTATMEPFAPRLVGHSHTVQDVCAGAVNDRPVVMSADDLGTIRSWDLSTLTTIRATGHDGSGSIRALALDPAGKGLVCALADGPLKQYSRATGEVLGVVEEVSGVTALAAGSADEDIVIAAVGHDLLSLRPGHLHPTILRGHEQNVRAVAVMRCRNRTIVASGGADGTVRLWDAITGAALTVPLREAGWEDKSFYAVAFAWDGSRYLVLAGGSNRHVIAWDLEHVLDFGSDPDTRRVPLTPSFLVAAPHTDHIQALAVCHRPYGDLVISVGDDRRLVVTDAAQPSAYQSLDNVHRDWITCVSGGGPGTEVVLTGSRDGVLRTWRVDESGVVPGASIVLDAPIHAVTLDERGTAFVGTDAGLVAIELADGAR